jgi:radical SAM enzyme (TIGR01210 family)
MKDLNIIVKSLRQKNTKQKNPREYISWWVEKDVLDDQVVDAFVMILRTSGCIWAQKGGCFMCGYINDAAQGEVPEKDILYQLTELMQHYNGEKMVKIYTSGSFFHEDELTKNIQDRILEIVGKKAHKIIVETRPEFVKRERLMGRNNLEIALGLESANDFVLKYSINKGFKLEDYIKAARTVRDSGLSVRTYLLIKPPFLSENEAIEDAVKSAKKIADFTDTISFNPVNIQRNTLVERLQRNGEYRAPWLWSVVEVLKQSSNLKNVRIISSPTAGGTKKGAHNCGKCDSRILKAIRDFSLTQDLSVLNELDCDCIEEWKDILNTEVFSKTQGDLFKLI